VLKDAPLPVVVAPYKTTALVAVRYALLSATIGAILLNNSTERQMRGYTMMGVAAPIRSHEPHAKCACADYHTMEDDVFPAQHQRSLLSLFPYAT